MPFAVFFGWFAAQFGDKGKDIAWGVMKFAAWATFVIASFVFMLDSILTLLNSVKVAVPATAAMVWSWVMPTNAAGCLSLILTAKVLRAMYDFKVRMATIKLESVR